MYGTKFGDKHSYDDWKLIPKSRPVISPPNPKYIFVEVPEADGVLDLTESMTGDIRYENRTITWEFNVIDSRRRWTSLYSEIANYLHGRKMIIVLDEDKGYYYTGRVRIDEWQSEQKTSTLVITAEVDPYKYEMSTSYEDWIWNDFCFETDIIRDYKDIRVDVSRNFTVYGSRRPAIPTFLVSSDDGSGMDIILNNMYYHLPDGFTRLVDGVIREGESVIRFNGSGTVSIIIRGGSL